MEIEIHEMKVDKSNPTPDEPNVIGGAFCFGAGLICAGLGLGCVGGGVLCGILC